MNKQVYLCEKCSKMVELLRGGAGTLVCCGQPMAAVNENTEEAAVEKHIPVVEETPEGIKVSVGSVLHPMAEKHLIEWVELLTKDKILRHTFTAEDTPVVLFPKCEGEYYVRAYCNLHGLWKG